MIKRAILSIIGVGIIFTTKVFAAPSDTIYLTVTIESDTTAPAVPMGLSAAAGDSVVDLSWNANPESDIAGYNLYRNELTPGEYQKVNSQLVTGTSYTDTGVINDMEYYYTVTAVDDSNNESGYSNEVSAMPQAGGGPGPGDFMITTYVYPWAFSPNNDSRDDYINITAGTFDIMEPAMVNWTVTIKDSSYNTVRTFYELTFDDFGFHQIFISWDGKDKNGNVVPDGGYVYQVTASCNGFSAGPESGFIYVDTTAPVINIFLQAIEGQYTNRDVVPLINVTDDSFYVRVDSTLNGQPFISGSAITMDGDYTLVVKAEDDVGNRSTETVMFGIDKTAPQILVSYPVNASLVPAGGYSDIWMNVVFYDSLSGVDFPFIKLIDKTGADVTCYTTATPSNIEYLIKHPGNGEYRFIVHLEDYAGNASDNEISFTVDSTIPEITASVPGGEYSASFTVDLLCSEDASIYYSTDGYPPLPGAANTTMVKGFSAPVDISGTTNLQFFAVDRAGNESPAHSEVYMFDELPESVTGLTASYSEVDGRAQLQWLQSVSARGYHVYRAANIQEVNILKESSIGHYPAAARFRLNRDLVSGTVYYDASVSSGITYWYAVSVVDQNGVEGPVCQPVSLEVPLAPAPADIQTAIQRALAWVESNQTVAGCWGEQEEKQVLSTSQILKAVNLAGINNLWVTRGIFYLRGHLADNSDYIARNILTLRRFNYEIDEAVSRLISQADIENGYIYGWGVQKRYCSDALTTALGRLAVHNLIPSADKTDYSLLDIPPESSDSLQSEQGYYGWIPRKDTSVFVSALVYHALGSESGAYQWIIDSQNVDGSFGSGAVDTAAVLLWIPLCDTAKNNALNYLVSRQELNGSWSNNDAYVTGLCLEALLKNM